MMARMTRPQPTFWLQRVPWWPLLVPVAAALVSLVDMALGLTHGDPRQPIAGAALAVVAGVILTRAQSRPIAVLVAVSALHLVAVVVTRSEIALEPVVMVALYVVTRQCSRRVARTIALPVAIVVPGVHALVIGESVLVEWVSGAALLLLPVAVADAFGARQAWIRNLVEQETTARVQAERMAIARDLHDLLAHSLSLIAVRSGVALHVLDRDPSQARDALADINGSAKRGLDELRVLLGMLRSADVAPLRPVPADPDDLSELLEVAAQAGVVVRTSVDGAFPEGASEAAVVAVHRIVAEALANVVRHAGAVATELRVDHGDAAVHLLVRNAAPAGPAPVAPGAGVGLVGMRERAESLGGSFAASGAADGGFVVEAVVPYRPAGVAS
jgi:signal transduction histidine kinase